ncbi:hypothetical protein EIO_1979 [Ketogulonicigenium vulgare Y25]|nr:hypothetical protein EIO_1979 [Ketogulonicigenium vulgare Y25]
MIIGIALRQPSNIDTQVFLRGACARALPVTLITVGICGKTYKFGRGCAVGHWLIHFEGDAPILPA